MPSGNVHANSAWLQCAVLAHNFIRWTASLGQPVRVDQLTVAGTVRQRLIVLPGRIVNHAGYRLLGLPLHWPWQGWFQQRLGVLRALQPATG